MDQAQVSQGHHAIQQSHVISHSPTTRFPLLVFQRVLDEFIAMSIMNETADNALARVRSKTTSPNLALKAKAAFEEEDDDPRDLYRRVTTLVFALQDHGSKDMDDTWIKRKFLKAIMPFNKAMSSVIR